MGGEVNFHNSKEEDSKTYPNFDIMSAREILQNIKQLPYKDRLLLIEKALKTLHEPVENPLEKAAAALLNDYVNDKELTSFTSLDFDKFYEAR